MCSELTGGTSLLSPTVAAALLISSPEHPTSGFVTTTLTAYDTEIEPDELAGELNLNTLLDTETRSTSPASLDTTSTTPTSPGSISVSLATSQNISTASTDPVSRSVFHLKHTDLDEFVQVSPEGSVVLSSSLSSGLATLPVSFTLSTHGYLTSGDGSGDIMFLRPADLRRSKTKRHTESSAFSYYDVLYGPKSALYPEDLAYRFKLDGNTLGFGYDDVAFKWYAGTSDNSTSKLYMAPSEASVPSNFKRIKLSTPHTSLQNMFTSSVITANSILNPSLNANSTESKSGNSSSSNTSLPTEITISTNATQSCPESPDVTQVWQVVNSVAEFALQDFCSTLLSYFPTTLTEAFANSTKVLQTTVTTVNSTETERMMSFTATNSIFGSTEYIASDDHVYLTKRQDTTVVSTVDLPAELAPFCAVDVIEGCFQAIYPSDLTSTLSTPSILTSTSSTLAVITNTTTTTLATASITVLANATAISYPGTGLVSPDSGTYRLWYLYWPDYSSTPALFLRSASTGAARFKAEYRPNLDAYRLATTPYDDGERYYMSIIAGIPDIDDYSIGLRTLNDIDSDERSVMLFVNYDLSSRYIAVNTTLTGTDRNTMYGCPVNVAGQLVSQVRLYRGGDGIVPGNCQPWSNLVFAG
ncbi:hypothetical protein TWF696_008489 [Orbilia brochopaga]|uniref:Uncharacterized protein n=1 Tax=Orbilia brochopaga TaxID=3140254 RepID=A0AAV9UG41_9PEZI